MINIPPNPGNTTPVKPVVGRRRTEPVEPSRPTEDDLQSGTEQPDFIERRKATHDRRQRGSGRGPYNQRAGRDRRKNPGRPAVDTEV